MFILSNLCPLISVRWSGERLDHCKTGESDYCPRSFRKMLHRQQQHWQGWNQFGMTGVFLSAPRYNWCAPLSHPSSCMLVSHGPSQQSSKEEYKHGNEVLPQDSLHLKQRPCYQQGSPCQDPAGNWATQRPPDHCKEIQTAVVWSCLLFIRSGQNHLARHSERGKNTRQTEEEVGRQHQGTDRPGVCQVPESSGEQGKMEETGCEIICGGQTTFAVKG